MTCAHLSCHHPATARGLCLAHYTDLRYSRPPRRIQGQIRRTQKVAVEAEMQGRIEDALWLLSWSTPPEEVARRVGYGSAASLMEALRKAGHPQRKKVAA